MVRVTTNNIFTCKIFDIILILHQLYKYVIPVIKKKIVIFYFFFYIIRFIDVELVKNKDIWMKNI